MKISARLVRQLALRKHPEPAGREPDVAGDLALEERVEDLEDRVDQHRPALVGVVAAAVRQRVLPRVRDPAQRLVAALEREPELPGEAGEGAGLEQPAPARLERHAHELALIEPVQEGDDVGDRLVEGRDVGPRRHPEPGTKSVDERVRHLVGDHVVREARVDDTRLDRLASCAQDARHVLEAEPHLSLRRVVAGVEAGLPARAKPKPGPVEAPAGFATQRAAERVVHEARHRVDHLLPEVRIRARRRPTRRDEDVARVERHRPDALPLPDLRRGHVSFAACAFARVVLSRAFLVVVLVLVVDDLEESALGSRLEGLVGNVDEGDPAVEARGLGVAGEDPQRPVKRIARAAPVGTRPRRCRDQASRRPRRSAGRSRRIGRPGCRSGGHGRGARRRGDPRLGVVGFRHRVPPRAPQGGRALVGGRLRTSDRPWPCCHRRAAASAGSSRWAAVPGSACTRRAAWRARPRALAAPRRSSRRSLGRRTRRRS